MKKIIVLILLFYSVVCFAQGKYVTLFLNNGNSVYGQLIKDSSTELTLLLKNGESKSFRKIEIRKIEDGKVESENIKKKSRYVDYTSKVKGFWGAVEIGSGVNIHFADKFASSFPTELLFTGGYRLNKYFQGGAGFGMRYYFGGDDRVDMNDGTAVSNQRFAIPVFANVRGIIIDDISRMTVPFWSANIGYTINDGFYFAPSLGLRIGSTERHHFIASLGYSLQCSHALVEKEVRGTVLNAVTLKVGYQF